MDVFGPGWVGHAEKLERNWRRTVCDEDVVLLCGDLSWAMRLEDALPDLRFIESLPGTKCFIRGNHDFWFASPGKVRAAVGQSMKLVRHDAHVFDGVGICGERGWIWPGHEEYRPEQDEKHWRRARIRLGLSLDALARLEWDTAVAMFHYPPLNSFHVTELCELIRAAGVRYCVYGHVHGEAANRAFEGERDGVHYRCVSADKLNFAPALVLEK